MLAAIADGPAGRIAIATGKRAAMPYYVILVLHLLCAFVFVGTVFFEVLVLHSVRRSVSPDAMDEVERAIGDRARRLMPWVLALLYAAGIALAWQYRALLVHPLRSASCSASGSRWRSACSRTSDSRCGWGAMGACADARRAACT
jgi:hypothetical protein